MQHYNLAAKRPPRPSNLGLGNRSPRRCIPPPPSSGHLWGSGRHGTPTNPPRVHFGQHSRCIWAQQMSSRFFSPLGSWRAQSRPLTSPARGLALDTRYVTGPTYTEFVFRTLPQRDSTERKWASSHPGFRPPDRHTFAWCDSKLALQTQPEIQCPFRFQLSSFCWPRDTSHSTARTV